MQKYAKVFNKLVNNQSVIEWDLRTKKSMYEIVSSATFYTEARKNLEMRCYSSYYFSLYYALFHGIYACIFLNPEHDLDSLLTISHKKIIDVFVSAFANSKKDIMNKDIKDIFEIYRCRREYYSYCTPFNNLFNYDVDLEKISLLLSECYQLASFHSLLIEKSYNKHNGKVLKLKSSDEIYDFDILFKKMFAKKTEMNGVPELDASCLNLFHEYIQYGFKPQYIVIDFEHIFDEFHTYDWESDYPHSENAIQSTDIFCFISRAIMDST